MNVTAWPTVDGFSDEATVVVVASKAGALTFCVGRDPLLGLTLASPLYAAVTDETPSRVLTS